MQRLEDGFSYFKEWAYELKKSGEFNSGVESKVFISWQVCSKQRHHIFIFTLLI